MVRRPPFLTSTLPLHSHCFLLTSDLPQLTSAFSYASALFVPNGTRITPLPSIASALFPVQRRGVPFFPSPATCHSPLSLLFAADSRNHQLSPIIAAHSKNRSRNSFVCHTYNSPRGCPSASYHCPPHPARRRAEILRFSGVSRIHRPRGPEIFAVSCPLSTAPLTANGRRPTRWSHCTGQRGVPQWI